MLRSEDRILTTHTGSLPRPPALTSLYVRRSRGEAIDAAELDRAGKAAVHEVVAKQIAAGVDVGNNGEQQREAFFLYVRHRMSGFGGGWTRQRVRRCDALSGLHGMEGGARCGQRVGQQHRRRARGGRRGALSRSCSGRRRNAPISGPRSMRRRVGFAEPFMTAPSPGIIAAAMRNAWYDTEDAYLAALGRALQVEYEAIVATRLRAADRCAGPRDGTAPLLPGPAARRLRRLCRARGRDDQRCARQRPARSGAAACLLGQLRGAARLRCGAAGDTADDPRRRRSAASCCRSPIRGTRTSIAA